MRSRRRSGPRGSSPRRSKGTQPSPRQFGRQRCERQRFLRTGLWRTTGARIATFSEGQTAGVLSPQRSTAGIRYASLRRHDVRSGRAPFVPIMQSPISGVATTVPLLALPSLRCSCRASSEVELRRHLEIPRRHDLRRLQPGARPALDRRIERLVVGQHRVRVQ
jgi:hypothetical protein